jgi:VWFA-related protein
VLFICLQLLGPVRAQQPVASPKPNPENQPQRVAPATQEPQTPNEMDVVKITTKLVQVDAVITDKNGMPVTDLGSDEIEIREDGRPQRITHFSYVTQESAGTSESAKALTTPDKNAPPLPPVRLRPEQVRRTIALVVDDLGLSFESTYYVRHALKKFVDEQMRPGDLVAIFRTSGGIGALQQFTADKRQLYSAIEHVRWYPSGRGQISAFAALGNDPLATEPASAEGGNEEFNQFREDVFSVGTLGALNYIVKGLRELSGRKSILLISDGLRIFNRDDPGRSTRVLQALLRLVDLANRASVVIYTMDARGLQTLGLTAADSTSGLTTAQVEDQLSNRRSAFFDSQDGLNYLAQQTGGIAIRNNNDLVSGLRRVMEDQKSYYLIGYRPDESTFDKATGQRKFHSLSLKVTRPGKFNVRMRNGFFGVSEEDTRPVASTPRERILNALVSPFGSAGVHLRLTSLFANDPKLGSFMRSLLHIAASDLSFKQDPDGWFRADFDIVAVTFGDNGNVVDQVGKTHTIRLRGETYKRVLRNGFVYFVTVPIKKAGAYQLRIALRDHGSERVGSASQFIEVPDVKKNRLTLSSVSISGIDPATLKTAQSEKAVPANPPGAAGEGGEEAIDPANSVAVRQFQRGKLLQYGFVIYNAHLDKAKTRPQLQIQVRLFRDSQPVFTTQQQLVDATSQTDLKRLITGGALRLGTDLNPGEYVLQVIVTDELADEKHRIAAQSIDFEIIK